MVSPKKGVITFEWIILIVLLVIGLVGGLAVLRDSTIVECAEVAEAILSHNKSYHITEPLSTTIYYKTNQSITIASGEQMTSDEEVSITSGSAGGSEFIDHDVIANPHLVEVVVPKKE